MLQYCRSGQPLPPFPRSDMGNKTVCPAKKRLSCVDGCRHRIVEIVQPEAEEEEVLPPEANPTLFLSGLPLDITKREVAHILRPCEGFKVRIQSSLYRQIWILL